MRTKIPEVETRPPPVIPDYEILRRIGRGSYGDVWMGRSVTGTLRAIKIVHRQNFELDRSFEREFEGIREFEPLSRRHPGLVDILHVSRNNDAGFYYYVMELADDCHRGNDIEPADYEPKTLASWRRLQHVADLTACVDYGAQLAEALDALHQLGLIHRDVKPSNVIFVDGVPKLADVGLVTRSGKSSFVGTEGFVPPEGPGSPASDIYSLGMLLYEMSTGRDRMDFPELPSGTLDEEQWTQWRGINQVICKATAPKAEDRYESGSKLAEALRASPQAKPTPKNSAAHTWAIWLVLGCLAIAGALSVFLRPADSPPPPRMGEVTLTTTPVGASIWIGQEKKGQTPVTLTLPHGTQTIRMELAEHRTEEYQIEIGDEPREISPTLEFWNPPLTGKEWTNSIGMRFIPDGFKHRAAGPTSSHHFKLATGEIQDGEVLTFIQEDGTEYSTVCVPPEDALNFCRRMEEEDRKAGFLDENYHYSVEPYTGKNLDPAIKKVEGKGDYFTFRCVVIPYGKLNLTTVPDKAKVRLGEEILGITPLVNHRLEQGEITLHIRLEGFKSREITLNIGPDPIDQKITLEESNALVFGKSWQNSLDMRFVPLGDVMFSIWETRVRDFDAFLSEPGLEPIHRTMFPQGPNHPAVKIDRKSARSFCKWLTMKERAVGLLEPGHKYRLPTDLEWSQAIGRKAERGNDPNARHLRVFGTYPWGDNIWPPPGEAGNLLDWDPKKGPGHPIEFYRDGFNYTSPVGSFPPSDNGLYDLVGNAYEWVNDDFGGNSDTLSSFSVARGGSWRYPEMEEKENSETPLNSTYRNAVSPANEIHPVYGFRCVIAPEE